jgi:hypothetical protein
MKKPEALSQRREFRLTGKEDKILKEDAESLGLNPSGYLRMLIRLRPLVGKVNKAMRLLKKKEIDFK